MINKFSLEELINVTEKNGMKVIKVVEIKNGKVYCVMAGIRTNGDSRNSLLV